MHQKILEAEIVAEIHKAEILCRCEHKCRNGADCAECELLALSCQKTYVARHLMEKFDIRVKEDA